MGSNWTSVKLRDVCTIRRGSSPRPIVEYMSSKGMPWVKISDATESKSRYINKTNEFIKDEGVSRSVIVNKGDLILSNSGTAGLPKFMGITACIHDGWQTFSDFNGIDKDFLYYTLLNVRARLLHNAYDSTMKNLTLDMVRDVEVTIPSLCEQQKIAKVLSLLDSKIENNLNINQTLEQMAQALFKSWFVDFDPVIDNALDAGFFEQNSDLPEELLRRAEQRKIVREQPNFKPLPAETRQLFPAAFEECEEQSLGLGGWVPKGWAGRSVSEAITVNPKVKLAKGEMAAFVDMKSLPTTGYSIEDVDRKAFSGGAKFKLHDVLFARITPCLQNGKTGFVDFLSDNENGFGSTEFIVLRGNEFVDCTYVACLARHESFRQHAMQSMVGSSGRQRVQNSCFDDFFIVIPPQNIMNKFAGIVSTSFKKLKTNSDEIISLANVRDTLLPKLISGELSLNDDGTLASGNTDR